VKRAARIGLIAVGCLVLLGLAVWLNLPSSVTLLVQAIGQQRHPVAFDMRFAGAASDRPVQIELRYVPRTPILGITAHYWSIIAPLHIDNITRTERVQPRDGRVRFTAPLGLVGLSGYRLQSIGLSVAPAGAASETDIELGPTNDPRIEPVKSRFPIAFVDNGTYTFDGALALWRLTGAQEDTTGVFFSPRASNPTRQVIWDGLRTVTARIDLAHYPLPTFQAPVGWEGLGWKADGINLARPGAKLSERRLEMRRDATVRIPFSPDCHGGPHFVSVRSAAAPAWSNIDGLWRPVSASTWGDLQMRPDLSRLETRFVSGSKPPHDGVEAVEIRPVSFGTFRLFALCTEGHYDSVAVTWLDVVVR
jgi:hypothetical protein